MATQGVLPRTIDDLLSLMEDHAAIWMPTWAFWPEGAHSPELGRFIARYFAAHKAFYLAELIPFVKYDHRVWPLVVVAVHEVLRVQDVIHPDHRCSELLRETPTQWLPDNYNVR